MNTPSLPKLTYTQGERKIVSFRLPEELVKKLHKLAQESGWTITDVAQTALDYYVQGQEEEKPKRR